MIFIVKVIIDFAYQTSVDTPYVTINFGLRLHYYKNKERFNCTYITLSN